MVEKYIERCARKSLLNKHLMILSICLLMIVLQIVVNILARVIEDWVPKTKISNSRILEMPTNGGSAAVRRHGIKIGNG